MTKQQKDGYLGSSKPSLNILILNMNWNFCSPTVVQLTPIRTVGVHLWLRPTVLEWKTFAHPSVHISTMNIVKIVMHKWFLLSSEGKVLNSGCLKPCTNVPLKVCSYLFHLFSTNWQSQWSSQIYKWVQGILWHKRYEIYLMVCMVVGVYPI